MKYKKFLTVIIPLLVLGLGPATLMAQEDVPEEEEETPVQTRPVPYTSPDPTSKDAMMKGRKGDTQQRKQNLQQAPDMKNKLRVTPGSATSDAQVAPQSPQR